MPTPTKPQKVECLNPNTGGRMKIDKGIYDLFSKAIYHTLKKQGPLIYTQMVEGVYDCFEHQQTKFDGSISWYVITIKKDMEARGTIEVIKGKGKSLNRLKKQQVDK